MTGPWLPMDELTAPPPGEATLAAETWRHRILLGPERAGAARRTCPAAWPALSPWRLPEGCRPAVSPRPRPGGWKVLIPQVQGRVSTGASDQGTALAGEGGDSPPDRAALFWGNHHRARGLSLCPASPEAEGGRSQRREAPDPGRSVGDVTSGNLTLFPLHLGFSSCWSLHTSQKLLQIALTAHPGRDIAELWRPEPGLYPSLQVVASK